MRKNEGPRAPFATGLLFDAAGWRFLLLLFLLQEWTFFVSLVSTMGVVVGALCQGHGLAQVPNTCVLDIGLYIQFFKDAHIEDECNVGFQDQLVNLFWCQIQSIEALPVLILEEFRTFDVREFEEGQSILLQIHGTTSDPTQHLSPAQVTQVACISMGKKQERVILGNRMDSIDIILGGGCHGAGGDTSLPEIQIFFKTGFATELVGKVTSRKMNWGVLLQNLFKSRIDMIERKHKVGIQASIDLSSNKILDKVDILSSFMRDRCPCLERCRQTTPSWFCWRRCCGLCGSNSPCNPDIVVFLVVAVIDVVVV
mmetsp:Transcript_16040/g.27166  ORF Transcript_16040/g.27166 Transcript_16040/m.27166 type:complete len:312 (-) Transcript_16040:134-1069(-)